jgi:hypothetical protein
MLHGIPVEHFFVIFVCMKTKLYAGIGSRETPPDICEMMKLIATKLESIGYVLRSGAAIGADSAFESGVLNDVNKEIFKALDATPESIQMAEQYHPKWTACSDYAKRLHGRNCMILLGHNLDVRVQFVICWTVDGKATGGTGQAMRIAIDKNIPIFNLYDPMTHKRLNDFIDQTQPNLF